MEGSEKVWKQAKQPKLPKSVREKAEELEEELGDDIVIIKEEGPVVRWVSIGEHEWMAAREKGLLEDWQPLSVEGIVESKEGKRLVWKAGLSLSTKALPVDPLTPLSIVEDALWRAYGLEKEDIDRVEVRREGSKIIFKAKLTLTAEEVDGMRPYSLEYFLYRGARWEGED